MRDERVVAAYADDFAAIGRYVCYITGSHCWRGWESFRRGAIGCGGVGREEEV